jgi:capsular polysaccharide transport system permease protein
MTDSIFWSRAIGKIRVQPLRMAALLACILSTLYWLAIASERYVSESRLLIQNTNLNSGSSLDLSGLISGAAGGGNRTDQLLVREYLRSLDMAQMLDKELHLRQHYSSHGDWLSRMWWGDQVPLEWYHRYLLKRLSVEYDEFAGVLVIKTQAFEAELAQRITQLMVREGEAFMNRIEHAIALDQVAFLEGQVQTLYQQAQSARQDVLAFQEKKGLISPEAAAQTIAAIVSNLQAQLVELQAQRAALQAYLVADHPNVVQLSQRIHAVQKQIDAEQAKLAAPGGKTLNRTAEAFAQLEMRSQFAMEMYKTALTSLERGRLESTRTLKKVSVVQQPHLPQYAMEPQRLYNAFVYAVVILLLAGVLHLIVAVVRDHRD